MERAIATLGMEPRECLLCNAGPFERLFRRSGKWFWRCGGCELVFVHDIYPEFAEDTAHLETTYGFGTLKVATARQGRKHDELLALFAPERRTGRLLEVGCGQGLFLDRARGRGWEVEGVDVLAEVVRTARAERGLAVHEGELFDAGFPSERFDVVYMSEVIEHVVEPVPLLREVHRVLRPGGVAVLDTGNANSWSARLRAERWHYYRFGGCLHIRFYSPPAAAALGRAAGFAAVSARTRGFAFRDSREMRGRWFRPVVQLAQNLVSPFAGPLGAGHRLRIVLRREAAPPAVRS